MTVTSVSRWNGGTRDEVVALGKKFKPIVEKLDGEYRVSQVHTGLNTGQWLAVLTFPDWAAYGKAAQALYSDPAVHNILAESKAIGQLVDRTVLVGVDL